jgi:hypothetical protein
MTEGPGHDCAKHSYSGCQQLQRSRRHFLCRYPICSLSDIGNI